ncbi:MAG: hypothetical protein K2P81_07485 [Bacteriovoracaceae bacterium]|nr:hypothetical protein [Bacteriovoracaceae bacterium]
MLLAPSLLSAQSVSTPLQAPSSINYPGVYESFEKLIKFDEERYDAKAKELKVTRTLKDLTDVNTVDIDPDFMNSIILNSSSGYLKIAEKNRCAFYDAMLADLLRTKEGKIEKVFIQYQDKNAQNISSVMSKQDFLDKVVFLACPKTKETVAKFQIKAMDATIKETEFDLPSNREQCDFIYNSWLENPKTPYWCQVYDLLKDTVKPPPSTQDFRLKKELDTKYAIGKILRGKLSDNQQDFLENFCTHADNSKLFCDEFFSTNFFAKILDGSKPDIYIKDICQNTLGKTAWSNGVLKECVRKLKSEQESCFWGDFENSGLSPRPRCDHLSLALNYSSLNSSYDDCPRYSDQQAVTNMSRVIRHIEKPPVMPVGGFCSTLSAGTVYEFNKRYGNEDIWKASACYMDRIEQKEVCLPMFFGDYGTSSASVTSVMTEILFRTKGAGKEVKCELIRKSDYSPSQLKFRYGCFIVIDENNCGISNCSHRIIFNEKEIKDIKELPTLPIDYFPTDLMSEKYSQSYILQKDAKKKTKSISTVTSLKDFFKENPTGILHGIGCAEDLLPSFFKKYAFNQCTPLPFIIDGVITEGDRIVLVTRSAADNIHAPRLISWSLIYSAVKTYQHYHPAKQWTLYGLF